MLTSPAVFDPPVVRPVRRLGLSGTRGGRLLLALVAGLGPLGLAGKPPDGAAGSSAAAGGAEGGGPGGPAAGTTRADLPGGPDAPTLDGLMGLWKVVPAASPGGPPRDVWLWFGPGRLNVGTSDGLSYDAACAADPPGAGGAGRLVVGQRAGYNPEPPRAIGYRLDGGRLRLDGEVPDWRGLKLDNPLTLARDPARQAYLDRLNAAPARVTVTFVRAAESAEDLGMKVWPSYVGDAAAGQMSRDTPVRLGLLAAEDAAELRLGPDPTRTQAVVEGNSTQLFFRGDRYKDWNTDHDSLRLLVERLPESEVRVEYRLVADPAGRVVRFAPVSVLQAGVLWDTRARTKVVKEIPVAVAAGDALTFEDEHAVRHSWGWTNGVTLEADLRAGLPFVEAGIKTSIQTQFHRSADSTTTTKRSVQVRGGPTGRAAVLVVEEYRTGTVVVVRDGRRAEAAVEFREGFHFESRAE